jgi:hypothetical protein
MNFQGLYRSTNLCNERFFQIFHLADKTHLRSRRLIILPNFCGLLKLVGELFVPFDPHCGSIFADLRTVTKHSLGFSRFVTLGFVVILLENYAKWPKLPFTMNLENLRNELSKKRNERPSITNLKHLVKKWILWIWTGKGPNLKQPTKIRQKLPTNPSYRTLKLAN